MESNLNDVLGNAFYAQEQEEAKSKQIEDLIKSYSGASALLPPRQYGKPINPEKFGIIPTWPHFLGSLLVITRGKKKRNYPEKKQLKE